MNVSVPSAIDNLDHIVEIREKIAGSYIQTYNLYNLKIDVVSLLDTLTCAFNTFVFRSWLIRKDCEKLSYILKVVVVSILPNNYIYEIIIMICVCFFSFKLSM